MSTVEPSLRVLVADDEPFIRQILSRMLVRLGFEVVGSADAGTQVLELYDELHPDLVILDIAMPEMDGLETLRFLLDRHPQARVLMCTSFHSDQYVAEALEIGASGYLNKPFDLEKIEEVLVQFNDLVHQA